MMDENKWYGKLVNDYNQVDRVNRLIRLAWKYRAITRRKCVKCKHFAIYCEKSGCEPVYNTQCPDWEKQ